MPTAYRFPHEEISASLTEFYNGTSHLSFLNEQLENLSEVIKPNEEKRQSISVIRSSKNAEESYLKKDDVILIQRPDYQSIKICYADNNDHLLACQDSFGERKAWYWQLGDNTKSIMYRLGQDPIDVERQQPAVSDTMIKPLEMVKIFRGHHPLHWHYVTFGLSNLYADSDFKGNQVELSFRAVGNNDDAIPPLWPLGILRSHAAELLSGAEIIPGSFFDYGEPVFPDYSTLIEGVGFIFDPVLNHVQTRTGAIDVIQLVCLTRAELQAIKSNEATLGQIIALLAKKNSYLVSSLDRKSVI